MGGVEIFGIIGFMLACYAVVANDSIQTLGTFLSSNAKRPWWVLWIFASAILLAVLFYGYFNGQGDVAYERLDKLSVLPGEGDRTAVLMPGIQWWHALPPLVLLFLTRFGIPVSTTFLVLTLFALSGGSASDGILEKMIIKSAMGYVVAFACGAVIWIIISRTFERWVFHTKDELPWPYWITFQWL
ncbi:MAG TPA: hypothetical protein DCR96_17315, partial [Hyphomonas sp.]|nr:hypothetical protein [Hyphomonas sp.]